MAESKRTFQAAKMERDLDERLLQPGTYKDALNISIDSSEDANVGSAENLKGNNLIDNLHADITQNIVGLGSGNPNAEVIGTYAHPDENKIYYFVTGDNGDGIFEYDVAAKKVNTIVLDGEMTYIPDAGDDDEDDIPDTTDETQLPDFKYSNAVVTAAVNIKGDIILYAERGVPSSLTDPFNEYVDANTLRTIQVKVLVPDGFNNTGDFVYGSATATQQQLPQPVIYVDDVTKLKDTSATLNAHFDINYNLDEVGFYYAENTGGTTSYESFTNQFEITNNNQFISKKVALADSSKNPLTGVPESDITVIDGSNNTVSQSASTWSLIQGTEGRPAVMQVFDDDLLEDLPITVGQTSTSTDITDGLTATELAAGTKRMVEDVDADIVSPYSLDITGLTADTEYAVIAYAINSAGTSYSSVLTFRTQTAVKAAPVLPKNKLYAVPAYSTSSYSNVGYGDFYKGGLGWNYAIFATSQEGKFVKTTDVGTVDQEIIRSTSSFTTSNLTSLISNLDSSLDTRPDITGSEMSGTISTNRAYHPNLSTGDDLTELTTSNIPAIHSDTYQIPANLGGGPAVTTNSLKWTYVYSPGNAQGTDFMRQVTGYTGIFILPGYSAPTSITFTGGIQPITVEMDGGKSYLTFLADRLNIRKSSDLGEATYYDFYFGLGTSSSTVTYLDAKGTWKTGVDFQLQGPNSSVQSGWPRKTQLFKITDSAAIANNSIQTIQISDPNSELASSTFQIVKGTPTSTVYTSTFNLSFASTGSGTTPFLADFDYVARNNTINSYSPTATSYKIGPFESIIEGVAVIPIANQDNAVFQAKIWQTPAFDKSKLTVSISGKTRGTDFDYFVVDEAPGYHGNRSITSVHAYATAPAVIIVANPYILNGGTASVTHNTTITYAY